MGTDETDLDGFLNDLSIAIANGSGCGHDPFSGKIRGHPSDPLRSVFPVRDAEMGLRVPALGLPGLPSLRSVHSNSVAGAPALTEGHALGTAGRKTAVRPVVDSVRFRNNTAVRRSPPQSWWCDGLFSASPVHVHRQVMMRTSPEVPWTGRVPLATGELIATNGNTI